MSNIIKIKRGSSVPSSSDLQHYELGYRTGTTELYINDGGTYRQLGGGATTSGSNNQLLTDDGSGSITSESNLTFDGDFKVTGTGNSTFETVDFHVSNGYLLLSGTSSQRMEFRNTSSNANGWIGIPSWNTDAWHEYMPTSNGNELAYVYESSRHNFYRGVTINNGQDDYDFIVKGDSVTNLLYVDASTDRVGISTNTPDELVDINSRIYLKDDGTIHWGSAANHGVLSWDTGRAIVSAKGANNLDLKAASGYQVVVNETQSNVDFRVESDTNAHLLFADASSNRIGILSSSPNATLDVAGIGQFRGTSSEAVNLYLGQLTDGSAFMYEFSTYDDAGGILNVGDHLQLKSYRWGQDISFARNGQGGAVPTARFFSSGSSGYFDLYKATDPTNNANYETRVKLNVNGDSYLNGGLVGIGTTSPSEKLHVNGSIKADTSLLIGSNSNFLTSQLKVGDGTRDIRLNANHSSNAVVGTVGSHDFNLMTSNTFRMTVDSGGNIGIGTATPGSLLTVYKDGTQVSNPSTSYQIMTVSNSNGGIAIQAGASSDAFLVFGDYGQYDAGRIRYHNDLHHMDFCTGGNNPRMTIDDVGVVAIGHTSPWSTVKLDLGATSNHMRVGGNIYFYDSNRYIGRNGNHIEMYSANGTMKMLDALQVHNKYTTNGDQRNTYNHFSHKENGNVAGAIICNTDIPRASNRMTVLHFEGYAYGHGSVIDFKVCFYPYSGVDGQDGVAGRPLEYSIVDNGNDGLQKFIGVNSSGNIAIAIDDYDAGNKYYLHYHVNVLQGHNSSTDLGSWSGTTSTTDGFGWLDKRTLYSPIWNKERGDAHQDHHRLILGSGNEGHTFRTDSGYVRIGPQNSSWCHFITDRSAYYFDKTVTTGNGIFQSYSDGSGNYDLDLRRAQSTDDRILITADTHKHYVNGNEEFRVDASGTLTSGQVRTTNEFQVNSNGTTLRRYVSSWNTDVRTHDVLYNGYASTLGDYAYYKTSGNTATTHGMLLSCDNYLFWGRANIETGDVSNSATAPIADVCMRVDASGNGLFDGDVVAFSTTIASDARLKENVKDLNYGLKDVLDIRPVSFDWKEKRNGQHDIGVIAQEIEKIIPEVVVEVDTLNSEDTHKTVDYAKLTSVLIKAVQEQQQQINDLKEKLNG